MARNFFRLYLATHKCGTVLKSGCSKLHNYDTYLIEKRPLYKQTPPNLLKTKQRFLEIRFTSFFGEDGLENNAIAHPYIEFRRKMTTSEPCTVLVLD